MKKNVHVCKENIYAEKTVACIWCTEKIKYMDLYYPSKRHLCIPAPTKMCEYCLKIRDLKYTVNDNSFCFYSRGQETHDVVLGEPRKTAVPMRVPKKKIVYKYDDILRTNNSRHMFPVSAEEAMKIAYDKTNSSDEAFLFVEMYMHYKRSMRGYVLH